jgi:hypothetical protein
MMTAKGSNKMATSDVTFRAEDVIREADVETQCPGRVGFHSFSRGTQVKMMLNISARYVGTFIHNMISWSQKSFPFLLTTNIRLICNSIATLAPRMTGQYTISMMFDSCTSLAQRLFHEIS